MLMIHRVLRYAERLLRTDIRYILRGLFWFGVQHGASLIGAILTSIVFANFLPKETYGTYRYMLSLFALLAISTFTRLDDSLAISVARGFEGNYWQVFRERMKWGFLGMLAGLVLALYWYAHENMLLAALAIIIAIFTPFFEPPTMYNGFLIGRKNFKLMSLTAVANSIVHSIIIIATILATKNIVWILTMYMIANTAMRIASLWYIFASQKPNYQKDPQTLPYGKKLSLVDIVAAISAQMDTVLLFYYLGPAEVAAYAFIARIPDQLKVIPKYITALSTPKFSVKDIGDPAIKKETTRKSVILFLTLLAGAITYIAMAPFIFRYFFAPYKEYAYLSQIYALAIPLNFGGLWFNFIETSRRGNIVFTLNIISPLLRIVIIFFSIIYFGLVGLVWGFLITRLLISLLRLAFFYKA